MPVFSGCYWYSSPPNLSSPNTDDDSDTQKHQGIDELLSQAFLIMTKQLGLQQESFGSFQLPCRGNTRLQLNTNTKIKNTFAKIRHWTFLLTSSSTSHLHYVTMVSLFTALCWRCDITCSNQINFLAYYFSSRQTEFTNFGICSEAGKNAQSHHYRIKTRTSVAVAVMTRAYFEFSSGKLLSQRGNP